MVSITLSLKNSHVILAIKDDGKGFDASQTKGNDQFFNGEFSSGNGIKNMHTRAGDMNAKLTINSNINEGTIVQLTLPLTKSAIDKLPNMVIDSP
jgi:signal transduction histidine kinase